MKRQHAAPINCNQLKSQKPNHLLTRYMTFSSFNNMENGIHLSPSSLASPFKDN